MSDRLTISASFSILMMAIYVLFGANVEHMPLGPSRINVPGEVATAGSSILGLMRGGEPLFARD